MSIPGFDDKFPVPMNLGNSFLDMVSRDAMIAEQQREAESKRLLQELYDKALISTAAYGFCQQHPPLRLALLAAHNAGRTAEREKLDSMTIERKVADRFRALDIAPLREVPDDSENRSLL